MVSKDVYVGYRDIDNSHFNVCRGEGELTVIGMLTELLDDIIHKTVEVEIVVRLLKKVALFVKLGDDSALDVEHSENVGIKLIGSEVLVFGRGRILGPNDVLCVIEVHSVSEPILLESDVRDMVAIEYDNGFLIVFLDCTDEVTDEFVGFVKLICKEMLSR